MATSQEINLTMERYNSEARTAERKFDGSSSITVVKPNCDDEMLKDKMLDVDLRNAIKVPHRNLSQTEQQIKSKGQCVEKSDTQLIADDKLEKNANESLNLPDISLPDTDQYPGSIYKPRRIERGDEKNEQVLTSSRQYQEQAAPNNEENECIEQNLGGLKTALRQPETSMSEEYTNSDSDEKHLEQSFGGYTDYHYIVGKHEQTRIDNDTEKYSDHLDTEKYEIIIPSIRPLQNEGLVCDENKPCKEKTAKTINEANRNNTQSEVNECGARSVYEDKEHNKGMKEENVQGTVHENKVKESKISTDEDTKR
ncbi:uncharacterized protein LOC132753537 [Ruditapes philippinarum]|uniref:uncharacterized protein LOC132753537 n=1 Tax=Ruditapes philippinarum TaxID=129788 RepID=UPI00295AD552|nr:uncharacterized protein LOC132753537 [Ruditapes philippinarum]